VIVHVDGKLNFELTTPRRLGETKAGLAVSTYPADKCHAHSLRLLFQPYSRN
jgi:hypothetical protein